jgi:glycosyltransferase involved in cell wall biosynthesis
MKIAFFYRYAILGGCTTQLVNRLKLTDAGIEPHFFFLEEHGGTSAFGDYPHITANASMDQIGRAISSGEFDAAASIDSPDFITLLESCNFSGQVLYEVHTTYTHSLQCLNNSKLMQRVDKFVTPSTYLSEYIHTHFPPTRNKTIATLPNCINTKTFQPQPIQPKQEAPIVLWIGKLDAHKNWQGFLQTACRIKMHIPQAEFWMIGGETAPDSAVDALLSAASSLDLLPNLRWIQRIEYATMPTLFSLVAKRGGCLLITSKAESFCMAALEALCCGCPVVAPQHTALPELLGDGSYGELYTPDSVEDAVAKTTRLLQDEECRQDMISLALQAIPERYDTERIVPMYAELLTSHSSPTTDSGT